MVVLKKDIENDSYFAFRKTQAEVLETHRIDCIHVSDLIKECMRLPYLNKIKPIIGMSSNNAKQLYMGQLVHNQSNMSNVKYDDTGLILNTMNEVPLLYNWVIDAKVESPKLDDNNRWDFIAGSIDDVRKLGDKYIICDKKTTSSIDKKIKWGPSDENKLQINMYRVLLKKCYNIDAEWGCNIFVDVNPTSERDIVFPSAYKLQPIEETLDLMVQRAEDLKNSILGNNIPPKTRCFLCDGLCIHATFCFGAKDNTP